MMFTYCHNIVLVFFLCHKHCINKYLPKCVWVVVDTCFGVTHNLLKIMSQIVNEREVFYTYSRRDKDEWDEDDILLCFCCAWQT